MNFFGFPHGLLNVLGVLAAVGLFGCAGYKEYTQESSEVVRVAVVLGVQKFIDSAPVGYREYRRERVRGLTSDLRAVVDGRSLLVVEFESVLRQKIDWSYYEVYEAVLIDSLVKLVSRRLQERVDERDIAIDTTAMLSDVLLWMNEAAI